MGLPDRAGVLVRGVKDASPADRAGVERGDLIVEAAGKPVEGVDDLYTAIDAAGDGLDPQDGAGDRGSERTLSFDA